MEKPPILMDEEILEATRVGKVLTNGSYDCEGYLTVRQQVAKAQRDATFKWFVEWLRIRLGKREPIRSIYDDPGFIFTYGYQFTISEDDWRELQELAEVING